MGEMGIKSKHNAKTIRKNMLRIDVPNYLKDDNLARRDEFIQMIRSILSQQFMGPEIIDDWHNFTDSQKYIILDNDEIKWLSYPYLNLNNYFISDLLKMIIDYEVGYQQLDYLCNLIGLFSNLEDECYNLSIDEFERLIEVLDSFEFNWTDKVHNYFQNCINSHS